MIRNAGGKGHWYAWSRVVAAVGAVPAVGHIGTGSASEYIFLRCQTNVPLEAKDKLRWVDEGCVRIC